MSNKVGYKMYIKLAYLIRRISYYLQEEIEYYIQFLLHKFV